jgi:cell division protein FtsB
LKADVKKLKSDSQGSRNELKKLKDEVQKYKTENTKLKHEVKILNEALNDAGVDLRISSEFCGS